MAYQTGALDGTATVVSLLDLMKSFADGNGWTTQVAAGVYRFSQDECHANLTAVTTTTLPDNFGTGSPQADHQIAGRLRATDVIHTAAEITGSASRVVSNDLTPPYANYWLFGGEVGGSPYIHLVVQKATGRFCHLSLGVADKKGSVFNGGAYLYGMRYAWTFQSNAEGASSNGSNLAGSGHNTPFTTSSPTGYATYNLYMGDVDPGVIITDNSSLNYTNGKVTPLFSPTSSIVAGSGSQRWLNPFFHLGPNPLNGVTALMEAPIMRYTPNSRLQYVGSVPDFRCCSMIGREEAETVTFGTDEWMIFPVKRFLPWNPEPFAARLVTSGPYGYAIKKVT